MTDQNDVFRKINEMEAYLRKHRRMQHQRLLIFFGSLAFLVGAGLLKVLLLILDL